ncbi:cytochrome bd oxidase small subunit CydS [Siminovitchia acidinfaciens]
MHNFLIFYAPFIVLVGAIAIAFWAAPKDRAVTKK